MNCTVSRTTGMILNESFLSLNLPKKLWNYFNPVTTKSFCYFQMIKKMERLYNKSKNSSCLGKEKEEQKTEKNKQKRKMKILSAHEVRQQVFMIRQKFVQQDFEKLLEQITSNLFKAIDTIHIHSLLVTLPDFYKDQPKLAKI